MTQGLTAPQRARYSDHSLAAYLAPLVEGRRVAVVGPTSGEVARRFRALGAATVVAFGGAGDGIAVRALNPGAIAGFHGKLDCIVVPDATAVPLDTVLDEARRALGQEGIVAVAARPRGAPAPLEGEAVTEGLDYYELHDALAARFAAVQMLGRGPFLGYTIAVLGDGGEGLILDTRLMPDEPPAAEAFIAVASDRALALDPVTLVQVPVGEVLGGAAQAEAVTVAKVSALEEEARRREQKLKEVETASAERWVRIQRLEHELKSLDEDARKARDRAARLAKDLDDERKLRQRIELEAQMTRRAPELPRGADPEELKQALARAGELERALEAARGELSTASQRLADLERELDETQATEAELRAQLDVAERSAAEARGRKGRGREQAAAEGALAEARAEVERLRSELEAVNAALAEARRGGEDPEFARLERELKARAHEVITLREQLAEREAAVRELAFSLAAAEQTEPARAAQAQRERVAELTSLNAALAAEAADIVRQNEHLRERVTQLESELVARAGEAEQARFRVGELEAHLRTLEAAPPSAGRGGTPEECAELERALAEARQELEVLRRREAETPAAAPLQAELEQVRRALEEERVRGGELARQLGEAKSELQRQSALLASIEDRATQTALELEGARAGYTRRVRELEREVDQLVRALEVATTHAADGESEALERMARELDMMKAERLGVAMRLRDAEAALAARPAHAEAGPLAETGLRADQLLADLAETAARLASTEEALGEAQENALRAETRVAELEREMATLREVAARAAEMSTGADAQALETLRRESAERELLARSLVAQLEDRDLRLRAMERRLVEEVERARRTESEIWEVELRARDQRIAGLSREVERLRSTVEAGGPGINGAEAGELTALRTALEGRERELQALRGALEQVRAGLSSILVDGRGAVVAHDLVSILRQIEEPQPG